MVLAGEMISWSKVEVSKKQTKKWDKLPTKIWKVVLFKEDSKGNQKFYEYDGDHSWMAEGLDNVENEYLIEQKSDS